MQYKCIRCVGCSSHNVKATYNNKEELVTVTCLDCGYVRHYENGFPKE